jgi:broad specificity phosphatase PhoE
VGSIYLIRHGQASFGATDYDVLSPLGERQAQVLGAHMADLDMRLDRCIAGSLRRQRHTAEWAMKQLPGAPEVEIDPAFNEFDAEGMVRTLLPAVLEEQPEAAAVMADIARNHAEFQRLFVLLTDRWRGGQHLHTELESWERFLERTYAGVQRIVEQAQAGEQIAVFTSGGTIAALLHQIIGLPATRALEMSWQIVNTSLSQLKFSAGDIALASFNTHTHLQLQKAPELITYR